MGDGIMALWGTPVSHDDDPARAASNAPSSRWRCWVASTASRIEQRASRPLGVGFGIHTGPVVAGYIGSSKALSYTVIGDVANTSARLCAKALAGQILVSEGTRENLSPRFEVEELAPMRIRGKDKPMRVFNVVRAQPLSQVPATGKADAKVADHNTDPDAQPDTPAVRPEAGAE